MTKSDGGTFEGTCQTGEQFTREQLQHQDRRRPLLRRRLAGRTCPQRVAPTASSSRRATVAATAATRLRPRPATPACRPTVDGRDFGKISGVAPAAKIAVVQGAVGGQGPETQSGGLTADILAGHRGGDHRRRRRDQLLDQRQRRPDRSGATLDVPVGRLGRHLRLRVGRQLRARCFDARPHLARGSPRSGPTRSAPYYGTVTLGNGQKYAGISTIGDHPGGSALRWSTPRRSSPPDRRRRWPRCVVPTASTRPRPRARSWSAIAAPTTGWPSPPRSKRAGGIGMVLANPTDNSLDGDLHTVPTVHVNPPASAAIKTYAATAGATATADPGQPELDQHRRTRRSPGSPRAGPRPAPAVTRSSRT